MLLEIPPLDPKLPSSVETALLALCTALRDGAAESDRGSTAARREVALLKSSGLLSLAVPAQFGGKGASWATVLDSVRRVAKVSSALAERLACQAVQVATIEMFADGEQQGELLFATANREWLWGGVIQAANAGLRASAVGSGVEINGIPGGHWAVEGADRVLLAARMADGSGTVIAVADPAASGLVRRTERVPGTLDETLHLEFRRLLVSDNDRLGGTRSNIPVEATLRPLLEQLAQVHLYLGVCQAAFVELVLQTRKARHGSLQLRGGASELPPQMLQRYADLWTDLKATSVLARAAARSFEDAWAEGNRLTAAERGRLAIEVGEARQLAGRAGAQLSQVVFEAMSSEAAQAFHLDGWWRRLRAHSLHDPIDFRRREIGRWILTGELPRPSLYA